MKIQESIIKFLHENVGISNSDKILIICNDRNKILAKHIKRVTNQIGLTNEILLIENINIGNIYECEKLFSKFNIILINTAISLFHNETINYLAKKGKKVISLTGADTGTFTGNAAEADFNLITPSVLRLANKISKGKHIEIITKKGTSISGSIKGRKANAETGINKYKNPSVFPDIEVNTSIVELECNGSVIVDLSMTKFGLLMEPLLLKIKDGKIDDITGEKAGEVLKWMNSFHDPNVFQVAEFGFGMNPKARITGNIIEDEAKLGTGHIGFGNNLFMGGLCSAKIHFDMVYDKPLVYIDNDLIINNKELLI